MTRRIIFGLVMACSALAASAQMVPGYPDDVQSYDPREIGMLPPYCRFTQDFRDKVPGGNDHEMIERWKGTLGPTYIHMHHYCWGMMKSNRGLLIARTEFARNHYLNDAIREFDYVILRAPDDFVLMPEMLTRKGEVQVRLGLIPGAMANFERAIQIKPDFWPPYAHASDYYRNLGDVDKARSYLERGLAAAPETPALRRRLNELRDIKHAPKPRDRP